MPSMTPAGPANTTRQPRADSAAAPEHPRAGGCRPSRDRAPAGSSCRARDSAGGRRPGSTGLVGHVRHCGLRAGCATNHAGRGRARAKTTAPARPPSTSATSALARPVPPNTRVTAIMAAPATAAMARPATIPRATPVPAELGQRSLRDDGEDDRADRGAPLRRPRPAPPPARRQGSPSSPITMASSPATATRPLANVGLRTSPCAYAHPCQQEEEAVRDEPGREGGDGVGQRRDRRPRRRARTRSAGPGATPAPGGRRWPACTRPRSSPPRRPPAGPAGRWRGPARRWPWPGSAPSPRAPRSSAYGQLEEGEGEGEPGHRAAGAVADDQDAQGEQLRRGPGRRRPTHPGGPAGRSPRRGSAVAATAPRAAWRPPRARP